MVNSEWTATTDEMPLVGTDVLIYSVDAHGYAVAVTRFNGKDFAWFNSTNGLEFRPAPTHWRKLPAPPEREQPESAFVSYSSGN